MDSSNSLASTTPSSCCSALKGRCYRVTRLLLSGVGLFLLVGCLDALLLQSPQFAALLRSAAASANNDTGSNNKNESMTSLLTQDSTDAILVSAEAGENTDETLPSRHKDVHVWNGEVLEQNASTKSLFILHVGPPKTGTTTLQTQLTELADDLLTYDGISYQGRQYHITVSKSGQRVQTNPVIPPLVQDLWNVCREGESDDPRLQQEALQRIKETIDVYQNKKNNRKQNASVLVSDEVLSKVFTADCYTALQEYLQDKWQLVVIVHYRRLFEWIPSAKFQQERYKMDWPGPGPNRGGKDIGPLFPEVLQLGDNFYRGYHFTDFAMEQANDPNRQSRIPVVLIDLPQTMDLLTTFLCRGLLDKAPHACAASNRRIKETTSTNNLNKREEANEGNVLYYDALTLAALERGWINRSTWHRWQVKDMAQDYMVQTLNKTALDFPQTCPSQTELQEFLAASLRIEAKIFSQNNQHGPDTAEDLEYAIQQQQHERDFWHLANTTTTYCWIDTNATLNDSEWKKFFGQFQ